MEYIDNATGSGESLVVIGEGAFGLLVGRPQSNLLYKLLKEKEVHNAFACDIQKKAKECAEGVSVPVCKYVDQPFKFRTKIFPCFVKMQRIFPPPNQANVVHCCLKFEHQADLSDFGFIMPESEGTWMASNTLDAYLQTLDPALSSLRDSSDVASAIGTGLASFITAGINPFDVEYVLGCESLDAPVKVFAIDFGEARLLDDDDALGLGLDSEYYFPFGKKASEKNKAAFITSCFEKAGADANFLKHFSYALRHQYD